VGKTYKDSSDEVQPRLSAIRTTCGKLGIPAMLAVGRCNGIYYNNQQELMCKAARTRRFFYASKNIIVNLCGK
jgi:hypothetical protein